MSNGQGNKAVSSLAWKLLERFGFHGIKMVVQVVLARILMPGEFGVLSIMLTFTDFANIFVQSGLNTALIQNKNPGEKEFSTVFWTSFGISTILYFIMFFSAPLIASYYNEQMIIPYLRVMGLVLFGGAYNSVQIAFASKKYDFKSQFKCNLVAVIVSGTVAIIMAQKGFGVWALVAQQLLWQYISCILLAFTIKWYPHFQYDTQTLKPLFSFGWKMFASSLLIKMNTLISNLIVGKRYSTDALGYYTRASNFPVAFSDVAVNAISSVALVSFSDSQDDIQAGRMRLKNYVQYSYILIAPLMIGLACVSPAFITVLLTDKWISCVPYLVVFSLGYLFQPLCAIYGQAVSGVGRSDLYLRVFYIIKPISILLIFLSVTLFNSPIYVAYVILISQMLESFVQAWNIKKLFQVSYIDQLRCWWPPIRNGIIMAIPVLLVSLLSLRPIIMLAAQVLIGAITYFIATYFFNKPMIVSMLNILKQHRSKQ